jgi:hypothetical protein
MSIRTAVITNIEANPAEEYRKLVFWGSGNEVDFAPVSLRDIASYESYTGHQFGIGFCITEFRDEAGLVRICDDAGIEIFRTEKVKKPAS